jgi:hypothetical protein
MNTKKFFEDIENQVKKQIREVNDSSLSRPTYPKDLYEKFAIETPAIKKKEATVNLGQETITGPNALEGVPFTPGQKMDYAQFTFPVENYRLFSEILGSYPWNRNLHHSPAQIYYRELSQFKIEGNDKVIESIKANARNRIEAIEELLNKFKIEADKFNSGLEELIKSEIKTEFDKRNSKKDTENKLRPF